MLICRHGDIEIFHAWPTLFWSLCLSQELMSVNEMYQKDQKDLGFKSLSVLCQKVSHA